MALAPQDVLDIWGSTTKAPTLGFVPSALLSIHFTPFIALGTVTSLVMEAIHRSLGETMRSKGQVEAVLGRPLFCMSLGRTDVVDRR